MSLGAFHLCQRAISWGRIEALIDAMNGREPSAQRAFDRVNADDVEIGADWFELFASAYREIAP